MVGGQALDFLGREVRTVRRHDDGGAQAIGSRSSHSARIQLLIARQNAADRSSLNMTWAP